MEDEWEVGGRILRTADAFMVFFVAIDRYPMITIAGNDGRVRGKSGSCAEESCKFTDHFCRSIETFASGQALVRVFILSRGGKVLLRYRLIIHWAAVHYTVFIPREKIAPATITSLAPIVTRESVERSICNGIFEVLIDFSAAPTMMLDVQILRNNRSEEAPSIFS